MIVICTSCCCCWVFLLLFFLGGGPENFRARGVQQQVSFLGTGYSSTMYPVFVCQFLVSPLHCRNPPFWCPVHSFLTHPVCHQTRLTAGRGSGVGVVCGTEIAVIKAKYSPTKTVKWNIVLLKSNGKHYIASFFFNSLTV